jgi:hypothetical protein
MAAMMRCIWRKRPEKSAAFCFGRVGVKASRSRALLGVAAPGDAGSGERKARLLVRRPLGRRCCFGYFRARRRRHRLDGERRGLGGCGHGWLGPRRRGANDFRADCEGGTIDGDAVRLQHWAARRRNRAAPLDESMKAPFGRFRQLARRDRRRLTEVEHPVAGKGIVNRRCRCRRTVVGLGEASAKPILWMSHVMIPMDLKQKKIRL